MTAYTSCVTPVYSYYTPLLNHSVTLVKAYLARQMRKMFCFLKFSNQYNQRQYNENEFQSQHLFEI